MTEKRKRIMSDALPITPSKPPGMRCRLNRAEQVLYYLLLGLVLVIVCVLFTGTILGWW